MTNATHTPESWHVDNCDDDKLPPDLLEAADKVVASWQRGDLADAVQQLDAAIELAKQQDYLDEISEKLKAAARVRPGKRRRQKRAASTKAKGGTP
jgi:hypothetical protein